MGNPPLTLHLILLYLMTNPLRTALAALTLLLAATAASRTVRETAPAEPLTLWYTTPATNWTTQALPIGGGDMGAMIFGGVAHDRLHLTTTPGALYTLTLPATPLP